MDAFEELTSQGEVGPACYALFIRKAHRVVGAHGFPPPAGHARWLADDVADLVQEVFANKGRPRAITLALLACPSEDAVEGTVTTIIHNHLKDAAKATEVGKLRRRLEGMLRGDARFNEVPAAWWSLRGGPSDPSRLEVGDLKRAAYTARDVTLELPLNPAGKTSARNVAGLTAIAQAVLTAAAGSVHIQEISRAIAPRCGLVTTPPRPLTDPEGNEIPMPTPNSDPAESLAARETAIAIFARLDDAERLAVRTLSVEGSALATALGLGRRQAEALRERVAEKIEQVTTRGDDRTSVLAELVTLVTPHPGETTGDASSKVHEVAPAATRSEEVTR